jgi:farnesyl diphosphate synthase
MKAVPDPLLGDALTAIASDIDAMFDALLPAEGRLVEAMRYAAIGGGKRLRPLLLTPRRELYGVDRESACARAPRSRRSTPIRWSTMICRAWTMTPCAMASRRVHRAFDEATAVLAGDALQALCLRNPGRSAVSGDPFVRIELVAALAGSASGFPGHGRRADDGHGGRGASDLRSATDHPAAAAQDRRLAGRGSGNGRDPGRVPPGRPHPPARLCSRHRAGIPDRRRPAGP